MNTDRYINNAGEKPENAIVSGMEAPEHAQRRIEKAEKKTEIETR